MDQCVEEFSINSSSFSVASNSASLRASGVLFGSAVIFASRRRADSTARSRLQRIAFESLLSWCETQIIDGKEDTAALVQSFESVWHAADFGLDTPASLAAPSTV